jgi:DNA adenine methylase
MIAAMRYPGGKFRCYQKLINLIPTHRVYIETHLGGGAVLRHKTPAEVNIGVDLDSEVIRAFKGFGDGYQFHTVSAEEFLSNYRFEGDEFVYADPPYWPASRRSRRRLYRHTYTESEHVRLLGILKRLPCAVMLSGYDNTTYSGVLRGWRKHAFTGTGQFQFRRACSCRLTLRSPRPGRHPVMRTAPRARSPGFMSSFFASQ